MLAVDLTATMPATRAVLPRMLAARKGAIVNGVILPCDGGWSAL